MTQRPEGVPEQAEWNDKDNDWRLLATDDQGRKHGLVTYWRADGSLEGTAEFRHGTMHGTLTRYHETGEVAQTCEYDDGQCHGMIISHRPSGATTETGFDVDSPAVIARTEMPVVRGRARMLRHFGRDGVELSQSGAVLPPRPAGVPEDAFALSDEHWCHGEWLVGNFAHGFGLRRFWRPDGAPYRLTYYRDGKEVAAGNRENPRFSKGNPLVEAAVDGDDAAVDACLAFGLGTVSGLAMHAAYAGVPALAARLSERPADAQPWPDEPEPGRPDNVDADAVWVAEFADNGGWIHGERDPDTGVAVGVWRVWEAPSRRSDDDDRTESVPWRRVEFVAGRVVLRQKCRGYRVADPDRLAELVHVDGFPVEVEVHYDEEGRERLRRSCAVYPGELTGEVEQRPDGTTATRQYRTDGTVASERVTRDGEFLTQTYYTDDGRRSAEVVPATESFLDKDGDPVDVELWRGLDGDRVIAEGLVDSRDPVGSWRLFDEDGRQYATIDLAALGAPGLSLGRPADLGALMVALHGVEQAPWPAALHDRHDVDWAGLSTIYGGATHFPLLLKGLAQPHERLVDVLTEAIVDDFIQQGTIQEDVAGPALRYMIALVPEQPLEIVRRDLLAVICRVASREGALGDAWRLREAYRIASDGAENPEELYDRNDLEFAYYEIFQHVAGATPTWIELSASPDRLTRQFALVLLALSTDEAAAPALRERIAVEPYRGARATGVLGLAMHGDTAATRELLANLMADAATEPLVAFCAALTWVRMRATPVDTAADLLIRALTDELDVSGFGRLYLTETDSVDTDAASAIALLPQDQASGLLDRICALLNQVSPIEAVVVARSLLDIVFPHCYDADQPITADQRRVIAAIAGSGNTWTFNADLAPVLRMNRLPTNRDKLRALASEQPEAAALG